jgi:hypothetical protein
MFKPNDYRSADRVFRSPRARNSLHIDPSSVIQASSVVALKDRAKDKERISNQIDQVGRGLQGLLWTLRFGETTPGRGVVWSGWSIFTCD